MTCPMSAAVLFVGGKEPLIKGDHSERKSAHERRTCGKFARHARRSKCLTLLSFLVSASLTEAVTQLVVLECSGTPQEVLERNATKVTTIISRRTVTRGTEQIMVVLHELGGQGPISVDPALQYTWRRGWPETGMTRGAEG